MNDRTHEELSALMDGEASELELRRTIKSLVDDPELIQKWRRYHVARSVIQGEMRENNASRFAKLDISAKVSAAIESEPAHNVPLDSKPGWQERFLKPLSSVAVAASVSAMVVFGWQNFQQTGDSSLVNASNTVGSANALVAESSAPQYTSAANRGYVTVADSQLQLQRKMIKQPEIVRMPSNQHQRLNQYLVSHSGNAALNTASGSLSYTRVVHIAP